MTATDPATMLTIWYAQIATELADIDSTVTDEVAEGDAIGALRAALLDLDTAPGPRRDKLRAVLALLHRGLHPTKQRVFNGPVLAELRCTEKRCILARIYATSTAPVMIPHNSTPGYTAGMIDTFGGPMTTTHGIRHQWAGRDEGDEKPSEAALPWLVWRAGRVSVAGLRVLTAQARRAPPLTRYICPCQVRRAVAIPEVMHVLDTASDRTRTLLVTSSGTLFRSH